MNHKIINEMINLFDLNLSNLNIYTEAASNNYFFNPILALKAGARKVFAQSKDSIYGKSTNILNLLYKNAKELNLHHNLEILNSRNHKCLSESDIITNSGFVRPIDKNLILSLKKTAVIPLMWETWEYRKDDFDLDECKKNSILVLGTKETEYPCDMTLYMGKLAIKLLKHLYYDESKILLIGRDPSPAGHIYNELLKIKKEVTFVSSTKRSNIKYNEFKKYFLQYGSEYKFIILADFMSDQSLIGEDGLITFKEIENINPQIKIGIISGSFDIKGLFNSSLEFYPKNFPNENYKMKYHLSELGVEPVLKLFAAGLKVGQEMAFARNNGLNIRDSKLHAIKNSPAMDFI